MDDNGENLKLEELLKNPSIKQIVPEKVIITENAKKKAQLLGPLVAEIGKDAYEWYGFLLGNLEDNKYVVKEVVLAQKQKVSGAGVEVDGVQVAKATEEVKRINKERKTNYKILGWIHNHAEFDTFHSSTDHENIFTVLNSVSLNTENAIYDEFKLIESKPKQTIENGKIVIKGQDLEDAIIEYSLDNKEKVEKILKNYKLEIPQNRDVLNLLNDLLLAAKFEVREPKVIGFCYSIVVNNKGDEPHAEIAVIEEDIFSKRKKAYNVETKLEVVNIENDVEVDKKDLEEEIKEKIDFPREIVEEKPKEEKGECIEEDKESKDGDVIYSHGVIDESWGYDEDEKSDKKKNLTLDELAVHFTRELITSLDRHEYSDYVSELLGRVIIGNNFRKAIEETGVLTRNNLICRDEEQKMEERLVEFLSDKILRKLKKDKTLLKFMNKFVNADENDKGSVLEKYLPRILKESGIESPIVYKDGTLDLNPAEAYLKKFAANLIGYQSSKKKQDIYKEWAYDIILQFLGPDMLILEEAMMDIGSPKEDDKHYDYELDETTETEFKEKLYVVKHSDKLTKFMKEFNDSKDKSEVIKKYSKLIISKNNEEEEEELDELVKKAKGLKYAK